MPHQNFENDHPSLRVCEPVKEGSLIWLDQLSSMVIPKKKM